MNNTETLNDTTEDPHTPGDEDAAEHRGLPALILAHASDGRPPGLRFLPSGAVKLGRGSDLFDSGPLLDGKMSREHVLLQQEGKHWTLKDLGSRNGTWLQGKRLGNQPVPLPFNSVLRTGDTLMVFALGSPRAISQGPLIGASAEMGAIRASIQSVAQTSTTVLITGETGTGKEMVAQELHTRSARKGRLVSLNCAAIPEGLLASELFGHTKGSFTGASDARDGLFRAADGGTLFLDEIGEMPLSLQVQLLRVLETKTVRPVGSTRDIPVDVRVVAATNRDLPAAIQGGAFRPDLYVRLAQWQVRLPPLRERRADVPFLVEALLERRGQKGRKMTLELASALLLHAWPFNVRGLLNILTAAEIGCPGDGPLALCPEVSQTLDMEQALAGRSPAPREPAPTPRTNGAPPRAVLERLLSENGGRIADVARHLGCTRQQIYRWIALHQINVDKLRP
jgi:DNA-binding NtrC family response regulator